MRLTLSRNGAMAAAFVAAAARIFLALAVDEGAVQNGVWLSVLLGAIPALPFLIGLDGVRDVHSPAASILSLLLLLTCLADSAVVVAAIARSASYMTLERVSALSLTLPVCLAILWALHRNGDAVGYGAMLWMRLFPALLLLVIALQLHHYRPEWLRPLLGSGWEKIATQGVSTAGWFVPASAILFVSEDAPTEPSRRKSSAAAVAGASIAAALLLVLRLMMAPTSLRTEAWINRLDVLLTNGRAALYLQLPMMILWYTGLLHLAACECLAVAGLTQRLCPNWDGRLCSVLVVSGAGALSLTAFPLLAKRLGLSQWGFIAAALAVSVCVIVRARHNMGGIRECA